MGIFDKFKKKLTRGLRKVTPKEIAPALPFLAMAVPGMGFASNALLRYGLPQLLTAAGSARTSGKISPLNQALAGLASYSAGPGSMKATPDQISFAGGAPETTSFGSSAKPLGKDFAAGMPTESVKAYYNTLPTSESTLFSPIDPLTYARENPVAFKKFRQKDGFKSNNSIVDNARQFGTQGLGESIRNVGSGDIDKIGIGDLFKLGTMGSTASAIDATNLQALEAEAEAAARSGNMDQYRDAMAAVQAATARFSDPYNQYGNNPSGNFNPFSGGIMNANQGGRVGMNMGGGMMDTRAGYNMGGMGSIPQTPNVPQGMQLEGRGGGFIPMGAQERKDDVPAMLAKNEFVMTADAVRAAGGGSVEKGAQKMYDIMNQLEAQV